MTFDEWCKAFGERTNLEIVTEDGCCDILLDDMLVVFRHRPESGELLTCATVADVPADGRDLDGLLLKANHLFIGTRGATLTRDPVSGSCCLCRLDPIDQMTFDRYWAKLEDFVSSLEAWRKFLADYRPCAETPEDPPAAPDAFISV